MLSSLKHTSERAKFFLSRDSETSVRAFTTYVRPLLEYCTRIWSPYSVTMVMESVQRAFTKKLCDMNGLTYRERLSVLRLESLKLRRLKADLIMCFKILKGLTDIIPSAFLRGRHAILEVIV